MVFACLLGSLEMIQKLTVIGCKYLVLVDRKTFHFWLFHCNRCNKILSLKLFDSVDTGKRWSANVTLRNFDVLCISQFTLFTTLKGNKPDFHLAMEPVASKALYDGLLNKLRTQYSFGRILDGQFGAYMSVNIQNDGPVTISIESPNILTKLNKRDSNQKQSCSENNKAD